MTDASLSAKVTADIRDFVKKFDGLKESIAGVSQQPGKLESAFASLSQTASRAGEVLAKIGVGFSVGLIASQLLDVTRAAAAQAEQVERLAIITGTSTDTMQEWGVALNRALLGPEDLTIAMRTLNLQVLAAQNPASEAANLFEQMGIKLESVGDTESLIRTLADRFSQMTDPVKRSTDATFLLGRAGQQLIPFLSQGARAIDDSAEAARRMGAVFSSAQLKTLSTLDDQFDDLDKALNAFKTTVGLAFAPAATAIVEGLTTATGASTRFFQAIISGDQALGPIHGRLKALAEVLATFSAIEAAPNVKRLGKELTILKDATQDLAAIDLDALSQKFIDINSAAAQEGLGTKIRDAAIAMERLKLATGHAQEALGHFTLDRLIREFKEAQHLMADLFDIDVIQRQEQALAESLAPPDMSKWSEMQRAVAALRDLMPELDANEALLLATHNIQAGTAAVQQQVASWQRYRDGLSDAVESTRALESHQAELFQAERGFLGAADAARRVAFARVQAEEDLKRQTILDTFGVTERSQQKLLDLEEQSMAQRLGIIRQYPTFWEQQLQAVVSANNFSVGAIVSTWSSGIATAVVQQKDFSEMVKAAWQSTQIAMLQAGINTLIQWGAELALSALREIGLATALQSSKQSVFETGNAAQLGAHGILESSKTELTVAGEGARALLHAATAGLFVASSASAVAQMAAMGGAAVAMAEGIVIAIAGVFAAMGAGLAATVVGAPFAPAFEVAAGAVILSGTIATVAAGMAVSGATKAALAAIATAGIPAFATGGAVFGPTLALVGEHATRGNPEFIGHANQLGLGGAGGPMTIVLEVDGATFAKVMTKYMPGVLRRQAIGT